MDREETYTQEEYEEMEKYFPCQVKRVLSILQDKHGLTIPDHCYDFICRCLRQKDGNMDKAVKLIKAYYDATVDLQKWDATLFPSLHADFYQSGIVVPLQQRDPYGRRVFVMRLALWDIDRMNFDQFMVCLMLATYFMHAEYLDVQRNGWVAVYDYANFTLRQAWAIKQWRLPYLAKFMSNGVVGRIKGLHFINHPRIISMLYSGLKPFLKEKIKRRIMFHDSLESLHKILDEKHLPTFLGGTIDQEDDSCVDSETIDNLIKSDNFFKEMIKNKIPTK